MRDSDRLDLSTAVADIVTTGSRQPVPLAPPPDPAIFNELASIIEEALKESLAKFVVATYNNVGMPRAHCGSAGGLSIGIILRCVPSFAGLPCGRLTSSAASQFW